MTWYFPCWQDSLYWSFSVITLKGSRCGLVTSCNSYKKVQTAMCLVFKSFLVILWSFCKSTLEWIPVLEAHKTGHSYILTYNHLQNEKVVRLLCQVLEEGGTDLLRAIKYFNMLWAQIFWEVPVLLRWIKKLLKILIYFHSSVFGMCTEVMPSERRCFLGRHIWLPFSLLKCFKSWL